MQNSDRFERKFLEVVSEMVLQKGLNHSQFANIVFNDTSNAAGKWRRMRNAWATNAARPQGVQLSDARRMASALGKTLSELVFTVEQRIKTDQN